jgi:hypothetical protein
VSRSIAVLFGILAGATMLAAQDEGSFAFHIGGGVSTPLNPTSQYAGVSGNFQTGAGFNLNKHSALLGEFMWSGLPPNLTALHPVNAPFGNVNLYALTANYRFQMDRLHGSRFGAYFIAGGGWYYRYATVDRNYTVPPATVCQPIYGWWGYGCDTGGYVYTTTIASRGVSTGGVNGGVGFTIRLADSGFKFYVESRYHYAFSNLPSTLVPVTFGFRYN